MVEGVIIIKGMRKLEQEIRVNVHVLAFFYILD